MKNEEKEIREEQREEKATEEGKEEKVGSGDKKEKIDEPESESVVEVKTVERRKETKPTPSKHRLLCLRRKNASVIYLERDKSNRNPHKSHQSLLRKRERR